MNNYVCKMCGRILLSEEHPKYCYFDRMDQMEQISDENLEDINVLKSKMYYKYIEFGNGTTVSVGFEFAKDVKFNPFTGEKMEFLEQSDSLQEWQRKELKKVLNAN